MRFFLLTALILSPVTCSSNHLLSHRAFIPQQQRPTPAAALARRDAVPTLTFGPASNYVNKAPNTPTLTKSDLSLIKRSEPTGGLDIFLGPDKQKKVQDIIQKSCSNNPNSQCLQDMAEAFDKQELGLQSRQLVVFGVSALVLALAWWLAATEGTGQKAANHAFVPASDLSQAASVESSSTLVFATTTKDAHPITVMSTDKLDTTTSGPVVSTATAKGSGYDKGDVVISVPLTLGNRIHDFVAQNAGCANGHSADVDLKCIDQVAEGLMVQASQNGPFRALVLVTSTLPGLKDDLGKALADLLKSATQHLTGLALSDDGVKFLAEFAFWIVYAQIVKKSETADQYVIPASATTSTAPAATTSSECPPEDRKPNCSNCGSTQKNKDKSSGLCPGPKWKACPCIDGPNYPYRPLDNAAFAKAQAALKALPIKDRDPTENMVICAGQEKHDVLSAKVKDYFDTFCSKYDGQQLGSDTKEEHYDNGDGSWIKYWISRDQTNCGIVDAKINKDACKKAMVVALNKCGAGTTTKGATTGGYQCLNWGFFGADAVAAGKPVQCPDPNPLLNLAHNLCDTKCNGAGYERCSPDLDPPNDTLEDRNSMNRNLPFIKFSCYCKDTPTLNSPCKGMKCGDPIKIKNGPMKDGSPRLGIFRGSDGCMSGGAAPYPSIWACDVSCPNGNYKDCGKNGEKAMEHNQCRCSEGKCADQICVDAIKDYGEAGR